MLKFVYLNKELKITEIAGIMVKNFYNDLMVYAHKKAIKIIYDYLEIEPMEILLIYYMKGIKQWIN